MADKSGIEWTDASWNPTTGCDRVSPGCANCYALTLAPRLQAMAKGRGVTDPTEPYMKDGDPKTSGVGFGLMMHESKLDQPLRWSKPRKIFVNSMSDLFHPDVTDEFLDKVWDVMEKASQHTFQVLTKRPERMAKYLRKRHDCDHGGAPVLSCQYCRPVDNIWVGTSVENARWRTRIDALRGAPAAVRFLSCEPLLGPLADPNEPFTSEQAESGMIAPFDLTGIDWVIIGGESGGGARPMKEQWVRDIVAACQRQHVAPFVKQMGSVWSQEHLGHPGHGGDIDTFPEDLRIRKYPGEQHQWVDARNEAVTSGEMCPACGAIRKPLGDQEAVVLGL